MTVNGSAIDPTNSSSTSSDSIPCVISYKLLPNSTTSNLVLTGFATITDNVGVSSTSKPRFYFKNALDNYAFVGNTSSDNGWKYVVASNNSSPYTFNVDYSLLFTPLSNGDMVEYFVVAQDTSNNLSSFPLGAIANSNPPVENIIVEPAWGINSYMVLTSTLSGTINVGAGQTYTSLTKGNGLFYALSNTEILTGDLVVNITSDINEDSYGGNYPLYPVGEYPYGSNFTITIKPNTDTTRTIYQTSSNNKAALLKFYGADNVTIDGSVNGSGKYLTFRQTNLDASSTGPAIQFYEGCSNATVMNCIIETNAADTTIGSILIGSTNMLGSTYANDVFLAFNDIRDATAGILGQPANAIYSEKNVNSVFIIGNNIYNFSRNGVLFDKIADGSEIHSNSFYSSINQSTPQTCISVRSGNDIKITNNFIGGTNQLMSGHWINSGAVAFKGISTQGSNNIANTIANNTIKNINLTSLGSSSFTGIEVTSGLANIVENNIGELSSGIDNIFVAGTSKSIGILSNSTSAIQIILNSIANIQATGTGPNASLLGIHIKGTGQPSILSNTIKNLKSNSASSSIDSLISTCGILSTNNSPDQLITDNYISNLSSLNSSDPTTCIGITMNSILGESYIQKNIIYGLTNISNNNSAGIYGIHLYNGNSTVANNMISITNESNTNNPIIKGIYENTHNNRMHNIYYNSVRIGGTASTSTNSYAFEKASDGTTNSRNNIFLNERSGGTGKHYAIGYTANTSTGFSSDYNVLYSTDPLTTGFWTSDQTLSGYRTVSNGDSHSKSLDVNFTDETNGDLHIAGISVGDSNLRGIELALIGDDFDHDTRPSLFPYIGADEATSWALPIELLSYNGVAKSEFNLLTWTTATEINSNYFEVERLNSDKVFENIAHLSAAGNSREINQYQFHDATFTKENNIEYYRLKMVDRDDNFKYSDVIAVKRNGEVKANISLYPNPSTEIVNIIISNADVTKIQVKILDLVGKVVYENNEFRSNEINTIPVANFPSGIYTLQIVALTENINQKFIKK